MQAYFQKRHIPQNIWLGVSVEDKKNGVPRIDKLRDLPAKIKFLSVEPLLEDLGEINLSGIDWVIVVAKNYPNKRSSIIALRVVVFDSLTVFFYLD
jgi:protein gp37